MRWIALLVTSTLLLLSGCGNDTRTAGDPADSAVGASPTGTGRQVDYDFTATTVDGATIEGSSLEGRPAVLWFWSPWCPTCRAQSPNVSALAQEYEDQVAVVGVGGLDEASAISELAEQIPHVTHLVDQDGEVWQHFGVTAQSSYTVIDADGEIILEQYLDDEDLNELVARLATATS